MDAWFLLGEIEEAIQGSVTDEDLRAWAEQLRDAVYESDNMEQAKGNVICELYTGLYNARQRVSLGYRVAHNRVLEARYHNLYLFFARATEDLDVEICWEDTAAIRRLRRLCEEEAKESQQETESRQETEREKKYYAKAIKAGMMEKTESGYRWTFLNGVKGSKASLAYFLKEVFNPDGIRVTPFKRLEKLFGLKKDTLAKTTYKLANKPKWRGEIDRLFE